MRVLGIETSSVRGSVALIEGTRTVSIRSHSRLNAHGESIQPLIDELLAEADWTRQQLDRIAVGVGPGSFTGLRVGISLALGIGEGLGIAVVGVNSLQSMAASVPNSVLGTRCALLDARRDEVFAAAYTSSGQQLLAPCALPIDSALITLHEKLGSAFVSVGRGCELLPNLQDTHRAEESDFPWAVATALIGKDLPSQVVPSPCYVRNAVAIRPHLPPNPLKT